MPARHQYASGLPQCPARHRYASGLPQCPVSHRYASGQHEALGSGGPAHQWHPRPNRRGGGPQLLGDLPQECVRGGRRRDDTDGKARARGRTAAPSASPMLGVRRSRTPTTSAPSLLQIRPPNVVKGRTALRRAPPEGLCRLGGGWDRLCRDVPKRLAFALMSVADARLKSRSCM